MEDSVILDTIGQNIRAARERKKLSQEELARKIGKDQTAISEYENGKRKLTVTDLPAFATALDVTIGYFFHGKMEANELEQALLHEFNRIPDQYKQDALSVLRVLSNIARQE